MRYTSLYFFGFLIFKLFFSDSVESCNKSLRSSSFRPLFLSDTGASTPLFSDTELLLADDDSCDEDGDETHDGVVEEELADKSRMVHS